MMQKPIKIKLICFEDGIVCVGFRRISSFIKSKYSNVTTYIYNVGGSSIQAKNIFSNPFKKRKIENREIFINKKLIDELSKGNVLGFSCMSKFAEHIKKTISLVRAKNPNIFIVWGGVHATVFPEDAIQYADAVCVGEGEKAFLSLLKNIEAGKEIAECQGFWIRKADHIIKNPPLPLLTSEEMGQMPFQDYSFNIQYVTHDTILPMSKDVYISQQGSKYTSLWVLGCPFHCIYCSNSKFLKNDSNYGKIRHAHPEYIINEMTSILKEHDYVTYIELEDDMFFLADINDLMIFSTLYKEQINLSLFLPGLHPSTVETEKLEILVDAGLKKVRMGIQSGSKKTLSFYHRHTSRKMILEAAEILSSFYPRIIPPMYDIIIDNPLETEENKAETLSLLRDLKRPYMLYVYSLRIIPGTELFEYAENHSEYEFIAINTTYQAILDKRMGMMVYVLALYRPSEFMYRLLMTIASNNFLCKITFPMIKFLYVMKRLYYELHASNYQPLAMIAPQLPKLFYKLRKTSFKFI